MATLLHTLGWTLFHFLWQGLLLAAAVALALRALRGRDSRLRYAVTCLGLLLMLAAPPLTFTRLRAQPPALASVTAAEARPSHASGQLPSAGESKLDWRASLDRALPWTVFTWAFGCLVMALRLAGAWVWLQWLRRRAEMMPAPDPLQQLLLGLSLRMGVTAPLRLLVSRAVPGPTVLGWLRPVILIPPAMLGGLTPQALELILAHELAHVRRHDYLVNLFQSIAEVLLFFHPAVWWVSSQIRQERERCCDDLAVRVCGDALDYAEALTALEVLALKGSPHPAPRLALGARGDDFMSRIHRLISPTAPTPLSPRAGLALLALLGAGLSLQARAGFPTRAEAPPQEAHPARTGSRLTLDLKRADLPTLLRILANQAKLNLVLEPGVEGVGDFAFKNTPWDQILDEILPPRGLTWEAKNGVLHVSKTAKAEGRPRFTAGLFHAGASRTDYSGRKISLNLQNKPLDEVLRMLAQEGGVSIQIDPGLNGRYSYKFTDTPWDQILDLILQHDGLGWQIQDGRLHISAPAAK